MKIGLIEDPQNYQNLKGLSLGKPKNMKFGRKTQKNLLLEQDSLRGQDSVYQPCNFALQWK